MYLKNSNDQQKSSDNGFCRREQNGQKRKVIHLHDVAPHHTDLKTQKTTSLVHRRDEGNKDSDDAVAKAIFERIIYYLNQNNFVKAEHFRNKLIAEVPTAVRAIVRSGEIIEEKKSATMDPEKIRPWSDLFNQFTSREAAAFYFALKDFAVKPNQPVFRQGECDNRLYFIRSGSLKVKYFDYDIRKNISITTLRKGDIAGIETFFMLTNHTTNLVAAETSEISYLDKTAFQKIITENHAIESKLCKYCETKQIRYEQSRPETPGRRAHKRYKTDLLARVRRYDPSGNLLEEKSEVKIVDISSGGLAYLVKNLRIGEASHFHNSRIYISASYQRYELSYDFKKAGKVVSLKFLPFGECSVHVQFEEPLNEDTVIEIAQHTDVTAYI